MLFVLRVVGQALVAFFHVEFLPPMEAWYSMIARAILLWDRPIPIVFHWVLAAFVIAVGHSHRRRLAK